MIGFTAGEYCGRTDNGFVCEGVIDEAEVENCACHISPPCAACMAPREFCPRCGWEAKEEE